MHFKTNVDATVDFSYDIAIMLHPDLIVTEM